MIPARDAPIAACPGAAKRPASEAKAIKAPPRRVNQGKAA